MKIPKVIPRRPFYDSRGERCYGWFESDNDFVKNNMEAAVLLLEKQIAIQNKRKKKK